MDKYALGLGLFLLLVSSNKVYADEKDQDQGSIQQVMMQHGSDQDEIRIACYFTNWSQYRQGVAKFFPEDIDISLCTHLMYAFAKIENGKLAPYEWNDDSTPWSKGLYERFNDLKKKKRSLKTLLAVGGWNLGSQPFTQVVASAESRKLFIDHAIPFLRNRTFDGLDVDWEYPGARGSPPEDKGRFTLFMQELKQAFDSEALSTGKERLLLTAAVAAGKINIDNGYDIPQISKTVDFLSVMGYDLHGSWEAWTGLCSPLYPRPSEEGLNATLNQDWAIRYWMKMGAPAKKLLLGLSFYGRSFTLANPDKHGLGDAATGAGQRGQFTGEAGMLSYYEVCENLQRGWQNVYDDVQKSCYAYRGNQWVGYDNQESVQVKANYIRDQGLGGAMIWSFDLDDFPGKFCQQGPYPLLKKLSSVLRAPPKQ